MGAQEHNIEKGIPPRRQTECIELVSKNNNKLKCMQRRN